MEIHLLDYTHAKIIPKSAIKLIEPCVSYESSFWKDGQYGKKNIKYKASMIHRGNGRFLVGLVPKIKKYCLDNNISLKVKKNYETEYFKKEKPNLKGITFRDDQKILIDNAIKRKRGIIKAPTGTGKSILLMGVMSAFPNCNILFLCHSIGINQQIYQDFCKYFGKHNIAILGEGIKDLNNKRIVISSIQTMANLNTDVYTTYFDIVIVDESHHVGAGIKSQYGIVLQNLLCPYKIGFTATLPSEISKKLNIEGLIGPIIGELTINEAAELNILSKPKITLLYAPFVHSVADYKSYKDIYLHGIVKNKERNNLIVKEVSKRIKENKSVLIMVTLTDHGDEFVKLFKKIGIKSYFVRGSTKGENRDKIKEKLNDKDIHCVIATTVFKEGINIPNLDVIVLANGGKSDIAVIQTIGRALRRTKTKNKAEVIDILDEYRYLSQHTIQRIKIYVENNWI